MTNGYRPKTVDVSGAKLPIEELHLTFITDKLRNEFGFLEVSLCDKESCTN